MTVPTHELPTSTVDPAVREEETARLVRLLPCVSDEAGRRAVRERLVCLNMQVAREVAHRYEGRGVPADDLEQVAYLGLVKSVQRFDPDRGTDFLGFAVPTIRGEVRRWFRDAGWMVRPPRSIQELQARITRARSELSLTLGRTPGPSEIADHLGVDEGSVTRAMAANGCFSPTSLDATDETEEEATAWAARLGGADPGYRLVETRLVLSPLLRRLDDRERLMVRRRFLEGATQREIGDELGVTQTQVSRLMSSLLARMRRELEALPGAA